MGVKHPDWMTTLEKLPSCFKIGPGIWVLHPFIVCSHLRGGALLCLETNSPCFPHCTLHLSCILRMENTGLEVKGEFSETAGWDWNPSTVWIGGWDRGWVWGQPGLETLYQSISQTESISKGTGSKKSFKLTLESRSAKRLKKSPHPGSTGRMEVGAVC